MAYLALPLGNLVFTDGISPPPVFPPGLGPSGTYPVSGNLNPLLPSNLWTQGNFAAFSRDISGYPVDSNSATIIEKFTGLFRADFGPTSLGLGDNLAYNIVASTQATSPVSAVGGSGPLISEFSSGPCDPSWSCVEGWPAGSLPPPNSIHDHHGLWTQLNSGGTAATALYEMYGAMYDTTTATWVPKASVLWNLTTGTFRPNSVGSTDAAGMPITPLLCTYAELATGTINHAIRFVTTLGQVYSQYVWPARSCSSGQHYGWPSGTNVGPYNFLPMGGILRLKAATSLSGLGPQATVIATAMKKYGCILADLANGPFYTGAALTGVMDDRWDATDLATLNTIPMSAFEVIQLQPTYTATPSASTMTLGQTITFTISLYANDPGGNAMNDTTFTQTFYFSDNNRTNFVSAVVSSATPSRTVNYTPTVAGTQIIHIGSGQTIGLQPPLFNITVNP